MMNKLFSIVASSAVALSLCAAPAWGGVIEDEGWLYGEPADRALALAEERGVPVALLVTFRETTCPLCIGASQTMMSARPHKDMVRVVYYVGEGAAELNSEKVKQLYFKAHPQVKDRSNIVPDTYYLTAEGDALGFVPYETPDATRETGATVLQVAAWVKGVPGEVERADALAERGRYDQALDKIELIVRRDAQVSHLIQQMIGKAEADAPMPQTPVSSFYPELYDTKLAEYDALAKVELDAARALVAEDKLRDAQRALRSLARGPEALGTTAAAKTLLEEVEQKLRDGRE